MGIIELRNNVFKKINGVKNISDYMEANRLFKELVKNPMYNDEQDKQQLKKMLNEKLDLVTSSNEAEFNKLLQQKKEIQNRLFTGKTDYDELEINKLASQIRLRINFNENRGFNQRIFDEYINSRTGALALLKLSSDRSVLDMLTQRQKDTILKNSQSVEEIQFNTQKQKDLDNISKKLANVYSEGHLLRESVKRDNAVKSSNFNI